MNFKSYVDSVHERMIRAVVAFALNATNLSITMSIAAYYGLIQVLQNKVTSIDAIRAVIALPIRGYAAQKRAVKKALVE